MQKSYSSVFCWFDLFFIHHSASVSIFDFRCLHCRASWPTQSLSIEPARLKVDQRNANIEAIRLTEANFFLLFFYRDKDDFYIDTMHWGSIMNMARNICININRSHIRSSFHIILPIAAIFHIFFFIIALNDDEGRNEHIALVYVNRHLLKIYSIICISRC